MTAIIVTIAALPEAEAIAGQQWTVPLSDAGTDPATHMGCNWVGCPAEVLNALTVISGVTVAESWTDGLRALGVAPVQGGDALTGTI